MKTTRELMLDGIKPLSMQTADQQTPLPDREFLGRLVRMEWMAWAREQPNPKPSWLTPWEALTEPEREVDRRIGERIHSVSCIPYAQQTPLRDEPQPATRSVFLVVADALEQMSAKGIPFPKDTDGSR